MDDTVLNVYLLICIKTCDNYVNILFWNFFKIYVFDLFSNKVFFLIFYHGLFFGLDHAVLYCVNICNFGEEDQTQEEEVDNHEKDDKVDPPFVPVNIGRDGCVVVDTYYC